MISDDFLAKQYLIVNRNSIAQSIFAGYFYREKKTVPLIPRIEEIPLAEFDLSLAEFRIMNYNRILQIEKSMQLHGQLQPVIARIHKGKYQILDGFKRYYISVDLMKNTLQCQVLDIDLQQAKVLLLSYNRSNQSMEAWEEAMVLRDLLETHDLDQQSLARLTGYSPSWVSRRLSLIGKIDEQVSSLFKMGALTSSHARVLTRLPRGNQCDVARVITSWGLPSRMSDTLVDAFLAAENEEQRRYILDHPEHVFEENEPELPEDVYDERLSRYGNDLVKSAELVLYSVKIMLSRLRSRRTGELTKTEKVIITPDFEKVSGYAEKLTKTIAHLQIHK